MKRLQRHKRQVIRTLIYGALLFTLGCGALSGQQSAAPVSDTNKEITQGYIQDMCRKEGAVCEHVLYGRHKRSDNREYLAYAVSVPRPNAPIEGQYNHFSVVFTIHEGTIENIE